MKAAGFGYSGSLVHLVQESGEERHSQSWAACGMDPNMGNEMPVTVASVAAAVDTGAAGAANLGY